MSQISIRVVNNITKEYPGMYKVVVFKEPRYYTREDSTKRNREIVPENYSPTVSSLKRTKSLVRDIVLCNNFEYFCTFTFNPQKVDSFNFSACYHKLSTWLHNQKENSRLNGRELKYIFIPERHKSGRWHFHGLISGYIGSLRPSGLFSGSDRPIYNVTSFRSGFTTAVMVDSDEGVSNYVTKYITKDFIKTFNQRRFFASKNLTRPVKTVNSKVLEFTLPLFKRQVCDSYDSVEYIIDKCSDFGTMANKGSVAQCRKQDYSLIH